MDHRVKSPALKRIEGFLLGFEDDPLQEGVADMLEAVRIAIAMQREDVLRIACQAASVNWPLSGDQVFRLHQQVNGIAVTISEAEGR